MQIDDYADMKFTNKKFTEMLFSNKEFQKVFFDVAKEECRKLLTTTKTLTESVDNTLSNDVMALFRAMDQVEAGLNGVWMAFPAAEFVTMLITLCGLRRIKFVDKNS